MVKNLMRTLLWCLLLSPFVAVGLAAQGKPDFSGSWVLQDPRQPGVDIARALTIRQPVRRTTVLGEPMPPAFLDLTVERHFESGVRAEVYQIGTEGGTVSGIVGNGRPNQDVNRARSRVSVRWEGNQLRIETGRYSGPTRDSGPYTEHAEAWRLDEQGRLVITVVDQRSDSEVATRTLTYRRQ
jgi:hypothetical protein